MFECKILEHSIQDGRLVKPLATVLVTFPRVCLAEFVTHRRNADGVWGDAVVCERFTLEDMSKNSSSSRAIPFNRLVKNTMDNPYIPNWTMNQKGMQGDYADEEVKKKADILWKDALCLMSVTASELFRLGIHKQDCNRLLEPFGWVTQVITSSNWDNFFALRCHEAAFPPFRKIARMIYLKMRESKPVVLRYGQWHLPFVHPEEKAKFFWEPNSFEEIPLPIKISAARCAWVSYANHDKDASTEAVLNTYNRLVGSAPVHASPVEHQATPWYFNVDSWRSNLTGWVQARKLINYEHCATYTPSDEEVNSWPETKEMISA